MNKLDPKSEPLRKESLPYNSRIDEQFPWKRMVKAFEGGAWFAAEKDGRFYLICDERTMADFILPEDDDLLDKMLTVLEFDSEEGREQYIREQQK
jgi:hypothetical protein